MAVESQIVPIGSPASDFNLPSTDGKTYSLDSFKDAKALAVVFSCNHCPYAKAAWPLLIKLAGDFREKGVAFVAINPNDEIQYPEDSFAVMKEKVRQWQINFPYLRDENQEVARIYRAMCTPDIYLFDQNRKLYYHGRINDNWPVRRNTVEGGPDPQKVTKEELKEAIESLIAGNTPPETQNPSIGCSIKWKDR